MNSDSAYRVDLLTHGQAFERLAARPAVILPLGGCEPFGGAGPIGVETLCAARISDELSVRCRVLAAPPLPFGCSTPFISFHGASGVKPRTFINMLCDIIHAYALQGAARVFLVNAAPFNKTPALEAAKRIEKKYGGVKVFVFDVNTLAGTVNNTGGVDNVNAVNNSRNNKDNTDYRADRADAALLAIAAYLGQEPVNVDTSVIDKSGINPTGRKSVTADQYRAWKKRGADPQKLRKLFPEGLLLPSDGGGLIDITPQRGKELFDRVAGFMQERIEDALTATIPAPCSPPNRRPSPQA